MQRFAVSRSFPLPRQSFLALMAALPLTLAAPSPVRAQAPAPPSAAVPVPVVRAAHAGSVEGLAFSPDGRVLASGGTDDTVRLWDAATGQAIRTIQARGGVGALAFSPDSARIAAPVLEGIGVWDARTGMPVTFLTDARPFFATALAFSADGKTLAGADLEAVRVWDVATGTLRRTIAATGGALRLTFLPDGTLVALGGDTVVRRWDPATGTPKRASDREQAGAVAVSRDGRWIATAERERGEVKTGEKVVEGARVLSVTFTVRDETTGKSVRLPEQRGAARSVQISDDGRVLAATSGRFGVTVWDIASGRLGGLLPTEVPARAAALSPDGTRAASGQEDGSVIVHDTATRKPLWRVAGRNEQVVGAALLPNGKAIVSGHRNGTVAIWSLAEAALRPPIRLTGRRIASLALSPTGTTLAVSTTASTGASGAAARGIVQIWNATTWKSKTAIPEESEVGYSSLAFTPAGDRLAGGSSQALLLWDAAAGKRVATRLRRGGGPLAAAPGGRLLASAQTGGIALYDLPAAKQRPQILSAPRPVSSLAFAPDNVTLYAGYEDGTLRAWNAATAAAGIAFAGRHARGGATAVAVSRDGGLLASGGADGAVKLWDARTGALRATLSGHTGGVTSIAFTDDGARALSAGLDGTIRLWDLKTPQAIATLTLLPADGAQANWIVSTPDGYYSASEGAGAYLDWRIGDAPLSSEEAARYRQPARVRAALLPPPRGGSGAVGERQ